MLRYDDPNYGGEQMKEARRHAREVLENPEIPNVEKVRRIMGIFPGGNHYEGPTEYVKAVEIARQLQEIPVINCGRCFAPEKCIAEKFCRRS